MSIISAHQVDLPLICGDLGTTHKTVKRVIERQEAGEPATVELLIELLLGGATEPGDVVINPRLVVRSSSGPPVAVE